METAPFDLEGLFRAIDAERERQGLSWAALARQVGVAASTIRRFGYADDAEADGVLALVRWLGVAPEDYVSGDAVCGMRLGRAGAGYVRVDMELVARAAGDSRGANGRTRTSIQNLVEVAQRSGQPVASLTRLSDR
jgi:transposase